ncbi:DNA-binding response regulator [Clostridia bacterium]|nr:DNA-binding response regulator [Clostridia bacterium]
MTEERDALCEYIESYLRDHCFDARVTPFDTGEALLDAFRPGGFDLLFLDIFLPDLSGMETAQEIRKSDRDCLLVFITTSAEYTADGFGVHASGYIVKPVTPTAMAEVMHACRFLFEQKGKAIALSVGGDDILVSAANIIYVEVFNKDTILHMERGEISTRISLDALQERLDGFPFLRCNRSYIVNMNHVVSLRENDFIMLGGDTVPIRKKNRKEIRMAYAKFLSGTPIMVN